MMFVLYVKSKGGYPLSSIIIATVHTIPYFFNDVKIVSNFLKLKIELSIKVVTNWVPYFGLALKRLLRNSSSVLAWCSD